MGVPSDGSYGIPEGVMYGVTVTTKDGEYTRVEGLEIDDLSRAAMEQNLAELEAARAGVPYLPEATPMRETTGLDRPRPLSRPGGRHARPRAVAVHTSRGAG